MLRSRLYLLAAAVLWSTAGAAVKLSSLSAWQIASGRSLIAALMLALAIPAGRRRLSWRGLAASVAYAATVVTFILANKLTTAANAIFLQDTAPLYVLLLSPLLLRERPTRWDVAFIAEYPSGAAFIEMVRDPVYREAVKHRQAAVADSRLIRMKPGKPGVGFGEEE